MTTRADEIISRLREVGRPERAEGERRYLKSSLQFLGASMPQIQSVVRDHLAEATLQRDELVALVVELWAHPIHESRMAAVEVLSRRTELLSIEDMPLLERLVRESRTWALVDGLAASVLGWLVERDPAAMSPIVDRWATDEDFWVRRSSLLCELPPIRAGSPLDRFLARAEPMLEEREFFIRKAIGWVLREAGKRRPAEVVAWLGPRTHRTSGVTIREAVKYLPPADAQRLMTAYREKRPAT
jgi:3-methyladenine DNA glycosylase AlkD